MKVRIEKKIIFQLKERKCTLVKKSHVLVPLIRTIFFIVKFAGKVGGSIGVQASDGTADSI